MRDITLLANIGAVIAGFGIVVLVFRIQREIEMQRAGEQTWVPWADRLLLVSTLANFTLVIAPLIAFRRSPEWLVSVAAAICTASCIAVAMYPLAILAHYRLIFGKHRTGLRGNPEPAERLLVITALAVAMIVFLIVVRS